MPPENLPADGPNDIRNSRTPEVEITKVGFLQWQIYIKTGVLIGDPESGLPRAFTAERAARKANRILKSLGY